MKGGRERAVCPNCIHYMHTASHTHSDNPTQRTHNLWQSIHKKTSHSGLCRVSQNLARVAWSCVWHHCTASRPEQQLPLFLYSLLAYRLLASFPCKFGRQAAVRDCFEGRKTLKLAWTNEHTN